MSGTKTIRIRGAREHNLQGISVDIPRDQLVVITGVSGSGKSSLAFDTVFAEGKRKYMESLSSYARQFLDQLHKPDVESIEGLPPTIAIKQRSGGHNPRSTVATTTEIYDYLRLLYARCGTPTCWPLDRDGATCGATIASTSASQIVDTILAWPEKTRIMVCAPLVRGRKGYHREVFESMQREGFVRARVNGDIVDLREVLREGGENPHGLARYEMHFIEAAIDRIVVSPGCASRLTDSVELALRHGDGLLLILRDDGDDPWTEHHFSERLACPLHPGCSLEEMEPRLFSFNSFYGACPTCDGLGTASEFDAALIVPDTGMSLKDGALQPWRRNGRRMNSYYARQTRAFCTAMDISRETPWQDLPPEARRVCMHGSGDAERARNVIFFEGVIPNLQRRYRQTDSDGVKGKLRRYMTSTPCPDCSGKRLRRESLAVTLPCRNGWMNIAQFTALTIEEGRDALAELELDTEKASIAQPILREIHARLEFLLSVGLDYLSLDRASNTLSGGEAQRIRLATQVGSGLVGTCYVLDEPTIGLHHRDNERLIGTLRHLCDIGNTVLVVEHDESMIRAADTVIDIGPGPGRYGGRVVAEGDCAAICSVEESITGDYLSGRKSIDFPDTRRAMSRERALLITGAAANNLQDIDVHIPLGGIVCVTGVSGSGKSSLVNEVLLKAARRSLLRSRDVPGEHRDIQNLDLLDRVIQVDQSPIGRTSRSNPATYTGIFDDIRKLFSRAMEARVRGYAPGRFSFNVKGGRCEECRGQGVKKIEMHFLPDVFVTCDTCHGSRYNPETLEVTYRHQTIADILNMTIDDSMHFFEAHPRILRMTTCLHDVGLSYLQLGQSSPTLSGGEAQRVKLASELGTRTSGHTLYILDEPTTGLHFADIERLMDVFHRLADQDNTLVVIEHNLDVIKSADWIIDLGPEGGHRGGQVIVEGTPETVAAHRKSHTGRALTGCLPRQRTTQKAGR